MRFRSRSLAALSIVLVLTSAIGAWHEPDDRDGEPVRVTLGGDHARLDNVRPTSAPEHCALCHWLRAFGSASPTRGQVLAPAVSARPIVSAPIAPRYLTAAAAITSRGPPFA